MVSFLNYSDPETPEEYRKEQRSKRCDNDNKDEEISPNANKFSHN